jgi:hypothetical protein
MGGQRPSRILPGTVVAKFERFAAREEGMVTVCIRFSRGEDV